MQERRGSRKYALLRWGFGRLCQSLRRFFQNSADRNAVYFNIASKLNHKAWPAVNRPGFNQICALRVYFDHHIGGFHLKGTGIDYVINQKGGLPAGGFVEMPVKFLQLLGILRLISRTAFWVFSAISRVISCSL